MTKVRALERHGLVELVEERRKGNMTERVMRATAASYVISPAALAAVAPDPDRSSDQLSALWLLALGARLVKELGELIGRATRARRRLATFGMDTEIRFASASDRAAFAAELSDAVEALLSKYHDEFAADGRQHRLLVALHPSITRSVAENDNPPLQRPHCHLHRRRTPRNPGATLVRNSGKRNGALAGASVSGANTENVEGSRSAYSSSCSRQTTASVANAS